MYHIEKGNIPEEIRDSIICIYGGGRTGSVIIDLFKREGLKISNIIDDDKGLQGKKVKGIDVISYQEFCDIYKNKTVNVVLTSIYAKEILKKIGNQENVKIYELFAWYNELISNNESCDIPNEEEIEFLRNKWELLKDKWEDCESIEVLEGLYKYFKSRDLKYIEEICSDEEHYFISEVIEAINEPLYIIDGGAYRGELLQTIRNKKIQIEKWYCLEPDEDNFARLSKQRSKDLDDVQVCIKKGLWSESGKVFFEGGQDTNSHIVPYETENYIEVTSIDEIIGTGKCNFIKMDVEGAEYKALEGAMGVIKRERPILTISIYHSKEDYWKIPTYLMNELENYRFYLRHHALICCETVLYAIPN